VALLDSRVAEFVVVVSNVAGVPGLARATDRGVPAIGVPHGRDREAHEHQLAEVLDAHGVEVLVLAGYMRLLTPWFVRRYEGRMLNIHPSLLPAFPGLDTHARALAAGCRVAGCTVHLVTDAMDAGPILGQAAVPVLRGDTEATLAARVLAAEHTLYPATLAAYLGGIANEPDGGATLANPRSVA